MAPISFHEKVLAMTSFRDIAHDILVQTDGKGLPERQYQEYRNIRFGNDIDREDIRASGILDIWTSPYSHPIMQALQYANYLKPFPGEGDHIDDTRLWDVFSSFPFSPNQITIPFLKVGSGNAGSKRKGKNDGNSLDIWKCAKSTSFEKVLVLMFFVHLSQEFSKTKDGKVLGKRKRFPYFTKTRLNSQKLAFAIQRVIRTWDRVARSFGFPDVEKMVIPYMVPSPNLDSFRPLPKREDGFAPMDLERTFSNRQSPTTNEALIAPRALGYTDDVDEGLRRLIRHFLSNLQLVAEDEDFYKDDTNTWKHGETFPKAGQLERFQSMMGALQTLQDALGIEEELEFLLPESGQLNSNVSSQASATNPRQTDSDMCNEECECHKAQSLIKPFMESYCRMHNTSFDNIIEADSTLRPDDCANITGQVQLVLTGPPQTISRTDDPKSVQYDEISESDMEEVVNVIHELLRPGGHAIIFCSQEQTSVWAKLFSQSISTDEDGASEPNFDVDDSTFIFAYKPGATSANNRSRNYYKCRNTEASGTSTTNVTMQALHIMKLGCSRKDAASMVRLRHFGHIQSRHTATENLIDNIPGLQADEQIYFIDEEGIGKWTHLSTQISVPLLRELICRFSLPGDILVDLFSSVFSSAVANCSIDNERMRVFVGSETDEYIYVSAERRVIEAFASTLADDVKRSAAFPEEEFNQETIQAAKLLVSHARKPLSSRKLWSRPQGLPDLSILPKYITRHLSLLWKEAKRYPLINGKPFQEWPVDLQGMMHSVDFEILLAIECERLGLYVGPSKVNHEQAGFGVFANRTFSEGDYVAPCYGRLVYDDLSNRNDRTKPYGEGFTACTGNEFLNYGVPLKVSRDAWFKDLLAPERIQHREKQFREVYVVPFLFNIASRINDPRRVAGDMDICSRYVLGHPRDCNVEFIQKVQWQKFKKTSQLLDTDALAVVATRHIKKDQELYLDYGPEHKLNVMRAYKN